MTSPDYGRPITDVMPMGGLMNVDRTGAPGRRRDRRGRRRVLPHRPRVRLRPLVRARPRWRIGEGRDGRRRRARRALPSQAAPEERERHELACRPARRGRGTGPARRSKSVERRLLSAVLVRRRARRRAPRRPRPAPDHPPHRPPRPHGGLRRGRRPARADRGRSWPAWRRRPPRGPRATSCSLGSHSRSDGRAVATMPGS